MSAELYDYAGETRKSSVEAEDNDEGAVGNTCDAVDSTVVPTTKLGHTRTVGNNTIDWDEPFTASTFSSLYRAAEQTAPVVDNRTEIYLTEFGQAVIAAACPAACPVGNPSSEYRLACTFYDANISGDGPPVWLSLVTGWDTMSTVNCIVESRVPAGAHRITKGGFVTGVGGQRTAAIGTVILPAHKMTLVPWCCSQPGSHCSVRFTSRCGDAGWLV